jgi:ABC-type transport system involved in multi-copper enzyme maturation permease subunit
MKFFPWRGFLYELRRGLVSVPLIVITVLIVLASFGILVTILESRGPPSNFIQTSAAYYFTGSEYHIEFYCYDQYGHGVSGTTVNVTVYQSNSTTGFPGTPLANVTGVTTGSGLVDLAVPLNGTNYSVLTLETPPPGWSTNGGGGYFGSPNSQLVQLPAGEMHPLFSGFTSVVQSGQGFRATNELLIFYPGPSGSSTPGYEVYWAAVTNLSGPLPESAMHHLGALNSVDGSYPLVVPLSALSNQSRYYYLQVELFTAGGTEVATDTNQSATSFLPPPGGTAGTSLAFGFGGTLMAYLVPLMAVLAAYSVYGRDRVTGVLEGVLARPVSRLGLTSSRYLAVIAALGISVTAAVGTLDALIDWVFGGFLPANVALAIYGALIVEVGAFTGLTFVLSHALRSGAGVLGSSLGLVALFTIGWIILLPLVGVLSGAFYTPGYGRTVLELQFVNPVQFIVLTEELYFGAVLGVIPFGGMNAPSAYGITLAAVIADGLAWVVLPAAFLVFIVRRSD